MDFVTPEYLREFLSPEAQVTLSHYLIVVGIIWATMGRKVSKRFQEMQAETKSNVDAALSQLNRHFLTIEDTLANAVTEMKGLKETVSKDLTAHSQRLGQIETSISDLSTRVEKLEPKKE